MFYRKLINLSKADLQFEALYLINGVEHVFSINFITQRYETCRANDGKEVNQVKKGNFICYGEKVQTCVVYSRN